MSGFRFWVQGLRSGPYQPGKLASLRPLSSRKTVLQCKGSRRHSFRVKVRTTEKEEEGRASISSSTRQGLHQLLHQAGPPSAPPPGRASISSSTRQGLQHGSSITQVLQHGSSISTFSHGFLVWLQTVGLSSKSPGDA
ncbi:unnamed protein product [Boreogadus saida]